MPQVTANEEAMRDFWTFVAERQAIYVRRFVDEAPEPWTQDPILRDYFFTNVYRELDRGTVFYMDMIREHEPTASIYDLVFNTLIFRLFNREATYDYIGFTPYGKWHWSAVQEKLKTLRDSGAKIFTEAFTVTGQRFGGFDDKIDNICWLIDELQDQIPEYTRKVRNAETMKEVFQATYALKGFGPFLAYEITIDLNYWLTEFSEDDFVNPGPGCKEGLKYLFNGIRGSWVDAIHTLRKNQDYYFQKYGLDFYKLDDKPLSARNIEHSLCEFSKYRRVKLGRDADGNETSSTTRRWKGAITPPSAYRGEHDRS